VLTIQLIEHKVLWKYEPREMFYREEHF